MLFTRQLIEDVNNQLITNIPTDVPCSAQTARHITQQLKDATQTWENTINTLLHPVFHIHRLILLAKQSSRFYSPCALRFDHAGKVITTELHVTPAMITCMVINEVRKYREYDDEGGTYLQESIYPDGVSITLDFNVITDELVRLLGDENTPAILENETYIIDTLTQFISEHSHDWEAYGITDGTHLPINTLLDPAFNVDAMTINQAKEWAPLWDPNYTT